MRKVHPEIVTKEDTALHTKLELNELSQTKRNALSSQDLQQSPTLPPAVHYKLLRRNFYDGIEHIRDTRIVEKLGSIMTREQKKEELADFTQVYTDFLCIFSRIRDAVYRINLREESVNSDGEYLPDQILRDIKEIENTYIDIATTSSLRYLHKCCEIYELDGRGINLTYPAHTWGNEIREFVYKSCPKYRKQKDGSNRQGQQQSFCAMICDCFSGPKKQPDTPASNLQLQMSHHHHHQAQPSFQYSQQALILQQHQASNNALLQSNTHLTNRHMSMRQVQN